MLAPVQSNPAIVAAVMRPRLTPRTERMHVRNVCRLARYAVPVEAAATPDAEPVSAVLPLLMDYVACPDCGHRGADHPKRGDGADAVCIGGYLGVIATDSRCACVRKRIGR